MQSVSRSRAVHCGPFTRKERPDVRTKIMPGTKLRVVPVGELTQRAAIFQPRRKTPLTVDRPSGRSRCRSCMSGATRCPDSDSSS
jgi:hypothetical protein